MQESLWQPAAHASFRHIAQIKTWMLQSGLHSWTDGIANVHGRIAAYKKAAPALLLGSHYDTVKDAGIYDGALGILVAIAAMKASILQVSHHRALAFWAVFVTMQDMHRMIFFFFSSTQTACEAKDSLLVVAHGSYMDPVHFTHNAGHEHVLHTHFVQ